MYSSPENNGTTEQKNRRFKAFFKKGSQNFQITSNTFGFSSLPGRYSQPAVDLNPYLKDKSFGGVNERIRFASWANSEKEFIFYMNQFFNLDFYTEEEFKEL